jgi:hypothetical protein
MRLISTLARIAALGGVALSSVSASAMPAAIPGQAPNLLQANYICNGWGHCWHRPYFSDGYYHPHYYGGWGWHHRYWGRHRHYYDGRRSHPHYYGGWGWHRGWGFGWHHWHHWHQW